MIARSSTLPRVTVVAITALVILTPLLLIFWQSFLNAPLGLRTQMMDHLHQQFDQGIHDLLPSAPAIGGE